MKRQQAVGVKSLNQPVLKPGQKSMSIVVTAKHPYASIMLIFLDNMLDPFFFFSIPSEVINVTSLKYTSQVVLSLL